jgi:hypothetical protein
MYLLNYFLFTYFILFIYLFYCFTTGISHSLSCFLNWIVGLFLIPNSLASTLYLALVRLYQRNYAECFKLLDSCSIDTKMKYALILTIMDDLTSCFLLFCRAISFCAFVWYRRSDERWIFNMFSRADNDQSPNAHACRLKLMSGVLFSLNEV